MELLERGLYPYAVAHTLDGDFIVDGKNWIRIVIGSSQEEIKRYYEAVTKPRVVKNNTDLPERQWQIISKRNSNIIYNVRWWLTFWTCECEGFYYRKHCSHIDKCKELLDKQSTN
jgi:hypothetical protein